MSASSTNPIFQRYGSGRHESRRSSDRRSATSRARGGDGGSARGPRLILSDKITRAEELRLQLADEIVRGALPPAQRSTRPTSRGASTCRARRSARRCASSRPAVWWIHGRIPVSARSSGATTAPRCARDFHQTAGRELAQRLADRRARHVEAPRDVGLVERCAGGSAPRTISSASCRRNSSARVILSG